MNIAVTWFVKIDGNDFEREFFNIRSLKSYLMPLESSGRGYTVREKVWTC